LIGANGLNASSDDLHKASFWLYLRQDIHMAELYQKLTIIDLEHCSFVEDLLKADAKSEDSWANHIYWLLGLIINYCFDVNSVPSVPRWTRLTEMVAEWKRLRPDSYRPCFVADPDPNASKDSPFPSIWLLSDLYGRCAHVSTGSR
jgi:hypothetical protein